MTMGRDEAPLSPPVRGTEWQDTIRETRQRITITVSPEYARPQQANRDIGNHVRQVVARLLEQGSTDVRAVASAVNTSSRTLQRRLREAGLTYAGLVQQVRCEAASHLLMEPGQTVRGVARRLGYSDPAHFTRAFHRWTGLTPRAFRRLGHAKRTADSPTRP
jgi:AraC-like DNA-binding protein